MFDLFDDCDSVSERVAWLISGGVRNPEAKLMLLRIRPKTGCSWDQWEIILTRVSSITHH